MDTYNIRWWNFFIAGIGWKTRSFVGEDSSNSETGVFEDSSMWYIEITILYVKNGVGESDNKLKVKS